MVNLQQTSLDELVAALIARRTEQRLIAEEQKRKVAEEHLQQFKTSIVEHLPVIAPLCGAYSVTTHGNDWHISRTTFCFHGHTFILEKQGFNSIRLRHNDACLASLESLLSSQSLLIAALADWLEHHSQMPEASALPADEAPSLRDAVIDLIEATEVAAEMDEDIDRAREAVTRAFHLK